MKVNGLKWKDVEPDGMHVFMSPLMAMCVCKLPIYLCIGHMVQIRGMTLYYYRGCYEMPSLCSESYFTKYHSVDWHTVYSKCHTHNELISRLVYKKINIIYK